MSVASQLIKKVESFTSFESSNSHRPLSFVHSTLTQEVALLSEDSAGSVAGNVLERAGSPAVAGPQVVLGGVAVGAVGLLKVLRVCVRVVLVLRWLGEGRAVAAGRGRLIRVAGGDAALVEGPTGTPGFILGEPDG